MNHDTFINSINHIYEKKTKNRHDFKSITYVHISQRRLIRIPGTHRFVVSRRRLSIVSGSLVHDNAQRHEMSRGEA